MLEALQKLGELNLLVSGQSTDDVLNILVQNPNQSGRYPKLFEIVLRNLPMITSILVSRTDSFKSQKKLRRSPFPRNWKVIKCKLLAPNVTIWKYVETRVTDVDAITANRLLYRRSRGANGPNLTPCAIVVEAEKTFRVKIQGWFKGNFSEAKLFQSWADAINQSSEQIVADLSKGIDLLPKDVGAVVCVVCEVGYEPKTRQTRYLGDFEEFRTFLQKTVICKFETSQRNNAVCGVCGIQQSVVYGEALTELFKFFNMDKPGSIAGGFSTSRATKNAPVCLSCYLKIDEGTTFVRDHLTRRLGGRRYWLIPQFYDQITPQNKQDLDYLLQQIRVKNDDGDDADTIGKKALERFETVQDELPDALHQVTFPVSYNFFFFTTQTGSAMPREIDLLLQDVAPTRLKAILEAARKARLELENAKPIEFGFGILLTFAEDAFLSSVENIFRGIQLERSRVFAWIMRYLRKQLVEKVRARKKADVKKYEQEFYFGTHRAVVLLRFLELHGVLVTHSPKEGLLVSQFKDSAEAYFSGYGETYSHPASKFLFVLGVLVNKVLYVQKENLKNDPFWKQLKDLRMQTKDFLALPSRCQAKLKQYRSGDSRLFELISDYQQLALGSAWDISTDEANTYFTMGLNLSYNFNQVVFPQILKP
jgi:CRISPR-associated protein Csh1